MRILILSQEPPFDPGAVATGNALRTHQLAGGLRAAGHDVSQAWLDRAGGENRFRSADELRGLLQREAPDVVLVSYWELLELLPFDGLPPIVLDFLAPRPLEAIFETPERAGGLRRGSCRPRARDDPNSTACHVSSPPDSGFTPTVATPLPPWDQRTAALPKMTSCGALPARLLIAERHTRVPVDRIAFAHSFFASLSTFLRANAMPAMAVSSMSRKLVAIRRSGRCPWR